MLSLTWSTGYHMFSQESRGLLEVKGYARDSARESTTIEVPLISYRSHSLENRNSSSLEKQPALIQRQADSSRNKEHLLPKEPKNEIKIKLLENNLTIENLSQEGILEIYNIMGTMVFNQRVNAGTTQVTLPVPRGYYIIKIGKFTRKIAIK